MNEFQRMIERGVRETQKAFLTDEKKILEIVWGINRVPCIPGNTTTQEQLISGGFVDNENMIFIVLLSDLKKFAGGKPPRQGQKIRIGRKSLSVASVTYDPVDPTLTITTRGEEQ